MRGWNDDGEIVRGDTRRPRHISTSTLEVRNSPCCAQGRVPCDINRVAWALNGRYGAKKFRAVALRLMKPKATVLFFSTGSYVIVGIKTPMEAVAALALVHLALAEQLQVYNTFYCFQRTNSVHSVSMGYDIDLDYLLAKTSVSSDGIWSEYEPEWFPGLRLHPHGDQRVVIVFSSGTVVVTGCRTRAESIKEWDQLKPFISQFRVGAANIDIDQSQRVRRVAPMAPRRARVHAARE
jgi:transcription initiation factor TFIID TATA-box-binding protein